MKSITIPKAFNRLTSLMGLAFPTFFITSLLFAGATYGVEDEMELELIPAQTISSSLEMSVCVTVNGEPDWFVNDLSNAMHLPACEDRYFKFGALTPENVDVYKDEIQRLKIQRMMLPQSMTTNADFKKYIVAGLFTNIKTLIVRYCDDMKDVSLLSKLTNLEKIEIYSCDNLTDVSALSKLSNLKTLSILFCDQLVEIPSLKGMDDLSSLCIHSCDKLSDISGVSELTNLKSLAVRFCGKLSDISPIAHLHSLEYLDCHSCDSLLDLSPLANVKHPPPEAVALE